MYEKERAEVCDYARRMWQAGFAIGSAGNVSVRGKGNEEFVITPSSVPYEKLTPEQIVVVDGEEDLIEGEHAPSFETPVHLAVYRARPDVHAVVHTHSRYATVLAVLHRDIPPVVDEMVVYIGGAVERARYGQSGSEGLAKSVVEALGDRAAVLLSNHGSLCVGKDLATAFKVCELVEHLAQVVYLASLAGQPVVLPEEVVRLEKEMYQVVKTM